MSAFIMKLMLPMTYAHDRQTDILHVYLWYVADSKETPNIYIGYEDIKNNNFV